MNFDVRGETTMKGGDPMSKFFWNDPADSGCCDDDACCGGGGCGC
jgi:hypothetical protein